jgi:hypothetical protein
MKLRFEKIDDQDYDVYAGMDNCLGSVRKMDNYWRAHSNGRGRYFHYRHEAAEWLISINQAEQANG